MSPIERSSGHATRALIISFVTIALVVLVLWGASVWITNRHNSRSPNGTVGGVFTAGSADHLLDRIHDDRQPVFFDDVSGAGRRPVVLSHTGSDSETGWHAFLALVPDAPADCVWSWERAGQRFTASCDENRHLDVAGTGAEQYPVRVVKGKVEIDFTTPAS
jgi:hypothetical protein